MSIQRRLYYGCDDVRNPERCFVIILHRLTRNKENRKNLECTVTLEKKLSANNVASPYYLQITTTPKVVLD